MHDFLFYNMTLSTGISTQVANVYTFQNTDVCFKSLNARNDFLLCFMCNIKLNKPDYIVKVTFFFWQVIWQIE